VCVKTPSVTNILLSIKNGVWATQAPVTLRIRAVFDKKCSESEQILLLFSIPGR